MPRPSDIEIQQAATALIHQQGDVGVAYGWAKDRARELFALGDDDGGRVMQRIARVVRSYAEPPEAEADRARYRGDV